MFEVSMDLISSYNTLCGMRTFPQRAGLGTQATVREYGDGWVEKVDLPGVDNLEHELRMLVRLAELDLAPEVDEEESSSSIIMRKINNGATLEEYVRAYLDGLVPKVVLVELFEATTALLERFWEEGFTHGDLHGRNIVVGMTKGGKAWRPYLIDFSSSYLEDEVEDFCYERALIVSEVYSAEDDLNFLKESLESLANDDAEERRLYEVLRYLC